MMRDGYTACVDTPRIVPIYYAELDGHQGTDGTAHCSFTPSTSSWPSTLVPIHPGYVAGIRETTPSLATSPM